jgi:hypothetical protein
MELREGLDILTTRYHSPDIKVLGANILTLGRSDETKKKELDDKWEMKRPEWTDDKIVDYWIQTTSLRIHKDSKPSSETDVRMRTAIRPRTVWASLRWQLFRNGDKTQS